MSEKTTPTNITFKTLTKIRCVPFVHDYNLEILSRLPFISSDVHEILSRLPFISLDVHD